MEGEVKKMIRTLRTIVFISSWLFFFLCLFAGFAKAAVYVHEPGWSAKDRFGDWIYGLNLNVTGYNKTHGIYKTLNFWAEQYQKSSRSNYYWRIYFELPDDGSEWEVFGQGFRPYYREEYTDGDRVYYHEKADPCSFHLTINTPGSFSGVSIGQAVTAANSAKTSADSAKTYARNAYNLLNNSTYGLSSTYDKVAALESTVNNLQTSITNITNNLAPQILKISGLNGATCTTGSTFSVVVDAVGATEFRVKADTGSWSSWTSVGSPATAAGISGSGAHTIYVEVRNAGGTVSSGQMVVFKL